MKRDLDLIRTILNKIADEAQPDKLYYVEISGKDQLEITYHLRLLSQAKLITVNELTTKAGEQYAVTGLSWEGHEFVEATKSNKVWNKVKEKVMSAGGSLTFEVIKQLATQFTKELLLL